MHGDMLHVLAHDHSPMYVGDVGVAWLRALLYRCTHHMGQCPAKSPL